MANDNKIRIHLLIDNERYPLLIPREEEEYYRKAAKQIDYTLNKYRKAYPEFGDDRHWAMTAVELAFDNECLHDMQNTKPFRDKLEQWEEEIDKSINENKEKDTGETV